MNTYTWTRRHIGLDNGVPALRAAARQLSSQSPFGSASFLFSSLPVQAMKAGRRGGISWT